LIYYRRPRKSYPTPLQPADQQPMCSRCSDTDVSKWTVII